MKIPSNEPKEMFQTELKAVLNRWSEESDISDEDLVQYSVESLNEYYNSIVSFDSDMELEED